MEGAQRGAEGCGGAWMWKGAEGGGAWRGAEGGMEGHRKGFGWV